MPTPRSTPPYLWPAAFGVSLLAHGLLLSSWHLRVTAQPTSPSGAPLPIQLVDPVAAAPTAVPDGAAPPAAPPEPEPLSPQVLSPPNPADPAPAVPTPTVSPPPAAPPPEPAVPTPAAPAPAAPGPASPSPAASPAPGLTGEPTAPTPQGGQIIPISLQPDPQGRDLPDQPPRLTQETVWIQPLLARCGWSQLPAMAAATVRLRLTVEPTGTIARTVVLQGSGQPEVDQLVQCLVERGLRLQPALTAGSPQLTDAVLLEVQAQF